MPRSRFIFLLRRITSVLGSARADAALIKGPAQRKNGMQMIRRYHHCDDVERMGLPDFSHDVAKNIDAFGVGEDCIADNQS